MNRRSSGVGRCCPAAPRLGRHGFLTSRHREIRKTPGTAVLPVPRPAPAGPRPPPPGQAAPAPADEGFWVGTSDTNRVWVQLTGSGESPQTVQAGDHISFTGTVAANPAEYAQQVGVDGIEGADQRTTQGDHLEVARNRPHPREITPLISAHRLQDLAEI